MAPDNETKIERTKRLNDEMRAAIRTGEEVQKYGIVTLTRGVLDRGDGFAYRAIGAVIAFEFFTKDNDPHGEHDFGAFEIEHQKLFWKIDYYDLNLSAHSPDKSDITVTTRVLTIMLANEY